MPKVSKVGKFRRTALAASTSEEENSQERVERSGLSRGQRKRQGKRDQYLRRQKLVLATLSLKRKEEQKRKIDGLDALKDALLGVSQQQSTPPAKNMDSSEPSSALSTNKSKKELAMREVTHLGLVMEHPSFVNDPFATMQEHLKNTLSGQAEELQKQSETRTLEEASKLEAKRRAKKEKKQAAGGGKARKKFRASRRTKSQ
eukprot:CAMPEP_0116545406 /NCGR_PEP_ID=MMETSP0397-20121206/2653_1 /TAXON_ID=216820 /ORGANISM="Cyclophora tenuis, Strain ECT3854" /LENGTH=201 /DNA_ID=CAMNT_0004069721 /DNA_START=221 /DNA_END=826 /DNA_ORIENTATION=-